MVGDLPSECLEACVQCGAESEEECCAACFRGVPFPEDDDGESDESASDGHAGCEVGDIREGEVSAGDSCHGTSEEEAECP